MLTCDGATAATYTGSPNKRFLVVHWIAPAVELPKTYKFLFTVVKKNKIWVKNTAKSEIRVTPKNGAKASLLE